MKLLETLAVGNGAGGTRAAQFAELPIYLNAVLRRDGIFSSKELERTPLR
ncbi:MAG: hypothetical protein QNM00_10590 [Gammaproteobacteria bacterium]|nr:hypothetical protein [Gammaproteobacteria bacterium]